jgi:hypothetical protein
MVGDHRAGLVSQDVDGRSFPVQLCLFSIFGIPLRTTFRVCSSLEFISGDEALDGATVKVKDGGCLPAVPA